jgi:hypothetical protein
VGKKLGLRVRRAARVDSTQRAIVDALRQAGANVQPLHQLGGGIPDLLVALPTGETLLIECKSGKGKLTPDQVLWHGSWQGRVETIRDPAEVAGLICGSA